MASVRGIGVAVMTRMCGMTFRAADVPELSAVFCHSFARCATPNLCCSSITASPSRLKITVSSITACVPTTICRVPFAIPSSTVALRFPFTVPVSSSTLIGMSCRNWRIVSRCCSARISVGAMMTVWNPLPTAISMVSRATSVLPEPTSPCSRRFICLPERMSSCISRITRFCAFVSSNFRLFL